MPANHSNTTRAITILTHSEKKKRFRYVATSCCQERDVVVAFMA